MNNNVAKPITVERMDLINNITDVINNAKLPFFVIESVLYDAYMQVRNYADKQYKEDLKKYNEQIKKSSQNVK